MNSSETQRVCFAFQSKINKGINYSLLNPNLRENLIRSQIEV